MSQHDELVTRLQDILRETLLVAECVNVDAIRYDVMFLLEHVDELAEEHTRIINEKH